MKTDKIKLVSIAGVFTALVFAVTAYLHIPTTNGYIHVGDSLIYLAACLLPTPYAVAVGAGGAMLADCLTGYAIWAPGSIIIKAATALLFTNKKEKIINVRNLLVLIPAAIICAGGYYLYEAVVYGNFIAPLSGILASLTQSTASSVLYVAMAIAIDSTKFRSKLL